MNTKYKKITKTEYKHIREVEVSRYGNSDISNSQSKVIRELKTDVIPKGLGILGYISAKREFEKMATEDDYNYYKEDGHQYVIYVTERTKEALDCAIKNRR